MYFFLPAGCIGTTPSNPSNRSASDVITRNIFINASKVYGGGPRAYLVVRQTTKPYANNAKSARVKAWGPSHTHMMTVGCEFEPRLQYNWQAHKIEQRGMKTGYQSQFADSH
ncbi:hypothetical protein K439DRAFT_1620645 [Ramaria rubella]|nr:hypothetical protein K439DRAFT_1620645 [Ramaria rubella]